MNIIEPTRPTMLETKLNLHEENKTILQQLLKNKSDILNNKDKVESINTEINDIKDIYMVGVNSALDAKGKPLHSNSEKRSVALNLVIRSDAEFMKLDNDLNKLSKELRFMELNNDFLLKSYSNNKAMLYSLASNE